MKVAIGMRVHHGPWGGGSRFAASLAEHLQQSGSDVTFDLTDPSLDVILLTEPRRFSPSCGFNDADILAYLTRVNGRAIVVHRVNECDERKKTRTLNRRLSRANRCADHTVIISTWLRQLFLSQGYPLIEPTVIRNGASRSVFHSGDAALWDGREKLRIITHHWSDNWMKGFDVYSHFDALLGQAPYRDLFEFTYVGRVPTNVQFRHVQVLHPLTGPRLASVLRAHHVYLTASQNEPAGMHHIEGALCGLPILYRRSGALPEYCEGFGLEFDEGTFDTRLLEMRERYSDLKNRMSEYPYDSERMCNAYENLFRNLLARREEMLRRRRWTSASAWKLRMRASAYDTCHRWLLAIESSRSRVLGRLTGHDRKTDSGGS